ncbi:hypothetical protein B0H66DRAFT_560251 [Apodospora peruviana]|uniref:Uncharacterized protein n=1 Tax=Apodospora peruviana TaxID=516989 RepID=A0AAE0M306_9PEZI|nr:hypothetical protein B0H66DRAFT_560251 [Apodospora peruviana]
MSGSVYVSGAVLKPQFTYEISYLHKNLLRYHIQRTNRLRNLNCFLSFFNLAKQSYATPAGYKTHVTFGPSSRDLDFPRCPGFLGEIPDIAMDWNAKILLSNSYSVCWFPRTKNSIIVDMQTVFRGQWSRRWCRAVLFKRYYSPFVWIIILFYFSISSCPAPT